MKNLVRIPFSYGKSPNPHNWHETAAALKDIRHTKPKSRASGNFKERFDTLEKLLKERK